MRENGQELQGELVEEQAEEWRPQTYGWPNSANDFAPETQLRRSTGPSRSASLRGGRYGRRTDWRNQKQALGTWAAGRTCELMTPKYLLCTAPWPSLRMGFGFTTSIPRMGLMSMMNGFIRRTSKTCPCFALGPPRLLCR